MRSVLKIVASLILLAGLTLLMTNCCNQQSENKEKKSSNTKVVTITKSNFGTMPDGQVIDKYTMKNTKGMEVDVINYGGIITSIKAPDKDGKYENVVLGFDNLNQYVKETPFFGAIIGRYGNRIAKGQIEIDGTSYQLDVNDGPNHLHGGVKGFDKVVWSAKEIAGDEGNALELTYVSKDGEGGYPGTLTAKVIYTLTDDNELEIAYEATTDKKTIVNLTQHSYFNLSGNFANTILDHELTINSDTLVPVDNTLIPTGELTSVEGTPFDFTTAKVIGNDINNDDVQLERGKGYDHCWVLNDQGTFREVAKVYHPGTGRIMEVYTSEPGIQFYSGNFLDGTLPMPGGGTYGHRTGLCLETEHYPDSPNQPNFPSVILEPGNVYKTATTYKFTAK